MHKYCSVICLSNIVRKLKKEKTDLGDFDPGKIIPIALTKYNLKHNLSLLNWPSSNKPLSFQQQ